MKVPILDLKVQFQGIRDELVPALMHVLEDQDFINGPAVREIELEVARYSRCSAAVAVSSGTDALLCSLMALGVGPGDEVITTPYTFFATAGSIARVGARPIFVDIDRVTFNIDVHNIAGPVTSKTRAIIPVHLFGQMADMDPLLDLARCKGIHVIEDAAQAIGATYKGRRAGSLGTFGCLSFFPSKNLGGAGDGGMILTQDLELAQRVVVLRNQGSMPKYFHKLVGGNFRLDTIQAAYLLVKLRHLDHWSERRRQNARLYDELFAGFEPVVVPAVLEHNISVYNQYVVRVPRRDELRAFLKSKGIGTEVYYPLCLHEQECFRSLGYRKGDFPEAERASTQSLALPVYPELTYEAISYVARMVKEFYD